MTSQLSKWLISIVMTLVIPTTGIICWGATNLRGQLSIALTGLVINIGLAFWYSWLDRRPKSFTDWLRN